MSRRGGAKPPQGMEWGGARGGTPGQPLLPREAFSRLRPVLAAAQGPPSFHYAHSGPPGRQWVSG